VSFGDPGPKCGRPANWTWCHIAILEVKGSAVRYWAGFEVFQAVEEIMQRMNDCYF
jgi:hypothetical protein